MAPRSNSPIPSAAPGLTGANPILGNVGLSKSRGSKTLSTYSHVRIEVDLRHERLTSPKLEIFRRLESFFREQEVVEGMGLLRTTALTLHALSHEGFRTVDHWEVVPGGWLALPEKPHRGNQEPIGHLLHALENDQWQPIDESRAFAVRLSGPGATRADLVVRHVHRERGHSLTLDIHGTLGRADLVHLMDALRGRLPVLRAQVAEYQRAAPSKR